MLCEVEMLSQEEIHELKNTINQIITDNGGAYIWEHYTNVDTIPSEFLSELTKKTIIVDKLAGITISILEDASRLLDNNLNLRENRKQLLDGLQAIELDYYQMREQNDKLKLQNMECFDRLQVVTRERDSILLKNQQQCRQFFQTNLILQNQIDVLRKQLAERSFIRQTTSDQQNKLKNMIFQEEIRLLVQEISDLRKQCFQQKRQVLEAEQSLQAAHFTIKQLESEKKIFQMHKSFQTPYLSNKGSMIDQQIQDSFIIPCSSLKIELQSIPNYFSFPLCSQNYDFNAIHSILSLEEEESVHVKPDHQEQQTPKQNPQPSQIEGQLQISNNYQQIVQDTSQRSEGQGPVCFQKIEEQSSGELSDPKTNEKKCQQNLEKEERQKSEIKQGLEDQVNEKEEKKELEQSQQKNEYLEGIKPQEYQIDEEKQIQEQINIQETFHVDIDRKEQQQVKIGKQETEYDKIEKQEAKYDKIEKQEAEYDIKNAMTKKMQPCVKGKMFRLQRMRSLSNALGSTGDTAAHHAKLYKKYRGQLIEKYPNLQKFTNKILQKKATIIADCLTVSRCSSIPNFIKKEEEKNGENK